MITIVSGLPRSGTSLMMQMLVAGGLTPMIDALRAADANNPKGYLEFDPVKRLRKENAWMDQAEGKVIKIVSHLLEACKPEHQYQVVFMVRDVAEVVASQESMMRRLKQTVQAVPAPEVEALFRQHLDHVREWLGRQPNFRVLYVDHRRLMADPEGESRRINAFFGGALDEALMKACVDPALHREKR